MNSFQTINSQTKEGLRMLNRLLALRQRLDSEIPQRNLQDTLVLGTWNIREFDSPSFGARTHESMLYIAEIIKRFDLVAIQEVRKDLSALENLVDLLGRERWNYVFTDITEGSAGNKERMAFLFDTRKVKFGGLASEIVLPPMKYRDENGKKIKKPITQVARTPFMVGFSSGDTSFILVSVHIVYGSSKANDQDRVDEIRHVAEFLKKRAYAPTTWSKNIALLGDFNIFEQNDLTMRALTEMGFVVPNELQNLPSNALQNKFYDQIAFYNRERGFKTTGHAGVFNFFDVVYREEDEKEYIEEMGERYFKNSRGIIRDEKSQAKYFKNYWRTHQMSDHLPMWVELKINFAQEYLEEKYQESIEGQTKTRGIFAEKKILIDERDGAVKLTENGIDVLEDFNGDDFSKRDFTKAQLAGIDLHGKTFSASNFTESNLEETNFNFTNSSDAIFEQANLFLTSFCGSDLKCSNFREAQLYSVNFFEADLSGADFSNANLERCNFDECILDDTIWDGASIEILHKDTLEGIGIDVSKINFW